MASYGRTLVWYSYHKLFLHQVALMQYQSTAELCRMVQSKEYMDVVQYKVSGLLDTHTYWTKQII